MDATGCTKCRNPSLHPLLVNGQCLAVNEASKACKTYIGSTTNTCSECYPSYYLYLKDNDCQSYAIVQDSNSNPICTGKALDGTEWLCNKCSKGYKLKTVTNGATKAAYCVPDNASFTNCTTFRTNGLCSTC